MQSELFFTHICKSTQCNLTLPSHYFYDCLTYIGTDEKLVFRCMMHVGIFNKIKLNVQLMNFCVMQYCLKILIDNMQQW